MLHTAQLKVNQLIGTNCLLCLSLFAQLDAWWSMVVKMVRMRLTGPLSWGWCKWSSVTGMGVLYLLMLSTCLGQDTEGKASFSLHVLITVLPLHFVSLFCLMCLIQSALISALCMTFLSQGLFESRLILGSKVQDFLFFHDFMCDKVLSGDLECNRFYFLF